jgi:hypothetical protein
MNIFLNILLVAVAVVLGTASLLFFIWACISVYKARGEPINFKQKKTSY